MCPLVGSNRHARRSPPMVVSAVLVGLLSLAASASTHAEGVGVEFISSPDDVAFVPVGDWADRESAEVGVVNGSDSAHTICLTTDAPERVRVDPACAVLAPGTTQLFSLSRDQHDGGALDLVASSDDGTIAHLTVPSSASSLEGWWQRWWDEIAVPSLRVLAELLVLGLLMSVLANWAADGMSSAWRRLPRPEFLRIAGYLVAASGVARLLLDRRSPPGAVSDWALRDAQPGWFIRALAVAAFVTVVPIVVWTSKALFHVAQRAMNPWPVAKMPTSWFTEQWWRVLWWRLFAVGSVATALLAVFWERPGTGWQSTAFGLAAIVAGATMVAWQSAYCPRLTLPDGSDDDAAKVVAALRDSLASLVPDAASRISLAVGPDTMTVAAESLAPVTGGPWMRAIVGVRDALVPRAGLRVRVWSTSDTPTDIKNPDARVRVHAVIDRGRRQVAAELIDSDEFHPESHAAESYAHDSVQEAASALAAWLLVTVADEVKSKDWGLYQTKSWRSLALQMAGSRRDEAGDIAGARALFNRACGADERNLPARFNSLSARMASLFAAPSASASASQKDAQRDAQTDVRQQLQLLCSLVSARYPGSPLALRAAYLQLATFIYSGQSGEADAEEAAQKLLRTLERLGVDPFEYAVSATPEDPQARERKNDLFGLLGPCNRIPGLPRGADLRCARQYGATLAPSAMVLWTMTRPRDNHAPMACEALTTLCKRRDVPIRARYNAGCALLVLGTRQEAWDEIRTAMIDEHLARWALLDPSLQSLWKPGEDNVKYLTKYFERQRELRRSVNDPRTREFVDFGLSTEVAVKVKMGQEKADLAWLQQTKDPNATLAPLLEDDELQAVVDRLQALPLATNPAIGPTTAGRLYSVGLGTEAKLCAVGPIDVRDRMRALLNACGEDSAGVTTAIVHGWQLAARTPAAQVACTTPSASHGDQTLVIVSVGQT
jgi:hypothetical protein